jgi:hypothetical protein
MKIIEENMELINKFLPKEIKYNGYTCYRCNHCLYKIKFDKSKNCGACYEEYEASNGASFTCGYHGNNLCVVCCKNKKSEKEVVYGILKRVFKLHGLVAFSKVNSVINKSVIIPDILEQLLIKNIKNIDRVMQLIILGVNIDFDYSKYNDSFTLLSWALFKDAHNVLDLLAMKSNGYIFIARDRYRRTALEHTILAYISSECNDKKDIEKILEISKISNVILNYVGISGYEYGEVNNKHWRSKRIEWLLSIGATYNLDWCINRDCHLSNEPCVSKLLCDTGLGHYLKFKEVLSHI